jgi:protein tyrosine phosphatase
MSLSGVGRAGTYTAIEVFFGFLTLLYFQVLHDQLHNPEVKEASIANAIQKVREHRMLAVQSSAQLTFIQLALVDHFLAIPVGF